MIDCFEQGPIRPPSEASSLLLRVTRNCPWNRCKFCHTYKRQKFELRPVEDIKSEIRAAAEIYDKIIETANQYGFGSNLQEAAAATANSPLSPAHQSVAVWLYYGGENVFLQDANTLVMPTNDLLEVITFLKKSLPTVRRITSYARSKTAARKTIDELHRLHEAGLSRLHVGLETGYDPLLQLMDKGVTAADHIKGGENIVESGISLCVYVILGLGGKDMWREHALATARVINEIGPEYVRVRTLTVHKGMPLYEDVAQGSFVRATDEEIIAEERLFIENLNCKVNFVSDHITNLLQEIEGKLPEDKARLLAILDRFLALSPEDKLTFKIGRRMGIFDSLDDAGNEGKRGSVERFIERATCNGSKVDDSDIYRLMERFV